MRSGRFALPAMCVAFLLLAQLASSARAPDRHDLGRSVRLRILVDKTMQPEAGWSTEEWMIEETADAGFNVYCPRRGHADLDAVRQVTEWCERHGLCHIPWMRGTLAVSMDNPDADGKRVVWEGGHTQPLWSVNSDEFWEWTNRYITEYARISAENEHLIGVFLDYENYAKGYGRNCYELSYDQVIMSKFADAQGIELPHLELDQRKPWLEAHDLHEAFAEFQINHWRQRCRRLRQLVDEINPEFQFCIYPAPGTPFMRQACYPEWATERAPLILADAATYGRPSRFLPQREAIWRNRRKLVKRKASAVRTHIPCMYAGGIDPVVTGADPEFCGRNAVIISQVTNGYWVFYEGPKYNEDHPEYFKWFTLANRAIVSRNYNFARQHRQTPEDWGLDIVTGAPGESNLAPPPPPGETIEYPGARLRRPNTLVIAPQAGQQVAIALRNLPFAHYRSLLAWQLRSPRMELVASGTIPHDSEDTVRFTAKEAGLYLLAASAGSCAYSVVSSNAPVAFYAREQLSLVGGPHRLYFHVPETAHAFTLRISGTNGETVRANVYFPNGEIAATDETTLSNDRITLQVDAAERAGAVWSVELTEAAEGVLEDNRIALGDNLPPLLSVRPDQVFRSTR